MKDFFVQILRQGGELALSYYGKELIIKTKSGPTDLVTQADVAVSDFLIEKIKTAYPDDCIISEEAECINNGSKNVWYIDPIDGTSNFAAHIPMWCTMIAYYENGEAKMSGIFNPATNELFFAEKGKGTTLNDVPVHVSSLDSFEVVNIAMGWRMKRPSGEKLYNIIKHVCYELNRPLPKAYGNMMGACYVAMGGLDGFINNTGADHDHAPAILIAQEAGATVTDAEGNPWKPGGRVGIYANPHLHKKILELINS